MARAFYENLEDEETIDPELMQIRAYESFGPMVSYLWNAIYAIRNNSWYVAWKKAGVEEVREARLELDMNMESDLEDTRNEEKEGKKIWVRISEPDDYKAVESLLDMFFETDFVYEDNRFRRSSRIRVLDCIVDSDLLCLERIPETEEKDKFLYLRPNTIALERQIEAIENLQNEPHPSQRGLLRLLEARDRAYWPEVVQKEPREWFYLDSEKPGTDEQYRFAKIALGTPDFAILEGPPGSGKTTAIVELILQLVKQGKRVLLCASTHVAVDNVLERIQDESEVLPVRVGDKINISPDARKYQLEEWMETQADKIIRALSSKRNLKPSQQELLDMARKRKRERDRDSAFFRLLLESANLVCGTTIGVIRHRDLFHVAKEGRVEPAFDLLILDEASKTQFTEFLVPAVHAKRWIITGDIRQLSPYVETMEVEANVKGILKTDSERDAVYNTFRSRGLDLHRGNPLLVLSDDLEYLNKVLIQGVFTGANVCVLDERITVDSDDELALEDALGELVRVAHSDERRMSKIWSSEIILATSDCIVDWWDYLPHDIKIIGEADSDSLMGRVLWWRSRTQDSHYEETTWEHEVAWRLVRCHELRFDPENPKLKRYRRELDDLIPRFIANEDRSRMKRSFGSIESIALPSVIEMLQQGFSPRKRVRVETALSSGLPKQVLKSRHVKLSYQHRMHPDISMFPRLQFYHEEGLEDPDYMEGQRRWGFSTEIGNRRLIWKHVRGNEERPFRNFSEASEIAHLIQRFLKWADTGETNERGYWEIAVLTYYRAQERLLKSAIAKSLNQTPKRVFWHRRNGRNPVRIEICTVDRFQGHEADYVIISLVRTRGVGFLDSPNRLNVALTRGRYQVLVVGDRRNFSRKKSARALHVLANDEEMAPPYRSYQTRQYQRGGRKER